MSEYIDSLSPEVKTRYLEKLACLGIDHDPYLDEKSTDELSPRWIDDVFKWPEIEFGDIYTYFINTPGPFTCDTMQAYRSLDAHMFYIDGWVHTCFYTKTETGYCIIKAKVNRSQAVTEKPHSAWVAIREKEKFVEFGHCTCMAGLGEVCSHVAAILYKVEAGVRIRPGISCTDLPCKWNQTFVKKVEPVPLAEINFDNPKKRKRHSLYSTVTLTENMVSDPTDLLMDLRQSAPNAVVFTVLDHKKCEPRENRLPPNLSSLYNEQYKNMSPKEFEALCESKFFTIRSSQEQNDYLEQVTRKQAKCGLWHQYRAGRITSSAFYAVTHTDADKPSPSLVKRIVYGEKINTTAIKWGNENESVALEQYSNYIKANHRNVVVRKSGFVINEQYPFLGSSPDGLVECDCCGNGSIEIKCPFKFKDNHPCLIADKQFCLKEHDVCDGSLKTEHEYFYQVQGQMGICDLLYCDFVCYTTKGIHVERIMFDSIFFRNLASKLTTFHRKWVLPELLCKTLGNKQAGNEAKCKPMIKLTQKTVQ